MKPADISPTRFMTDGGAMVYNYLSNFDWAARAGVGDKVPAVSNAEQILFVCHAMDMKNCSAPPPLPPPPSPAAPVSPACAAIINKTCSATAPEGC
eukprot:SAG22_NODE_8380_length_660_cov_0.969697_1_plen_95_part_10